ncbi:MAG: AtpZ/AtpI family protein [Candidatus Eiseniibacteriota bacterium]|nr:MAG: AtpZ/AtpI family protein [Candidatus Eisenbacteria bacterium]
MPTPSGKKPEDKYAMLRQAGLVTVIPFLLLVSPLVGYFLGRFLDKRLDTSFLWIVLTALGFVAGVKEVYRIIVRISREAK